MPNAVSAPSPVVIPDYELLRPVGRGSYGEVWLARNLLGELRAVKIIRREERADDRAFEREFDGLQKFEPTSRFTRSLSARTDGKWSQLQKTGQPSCSTWPAGSRRFQ